MSDALTDIARDERREACFDEFVVVVYEYLLHQTASNLKKVLATADNLDSVPGGYFGSRTNWLQNIERRLELLVNKDRQGWAKWLLSITNHSLYGKFKEMSPYKGKLLINVDYGCGFVNLSGDLQAFLDKTIALDKNMRIYDADKYLVVIDDPKVEHVEWIRCGIVGQDKPRSYKNK
jgi:hypothetical protein